MIDASKEAYEVTVAKKPFEFKPDFIYKTNRFFVKYHKFSELRKIYLNVFAKEKIEFAISIKFIAGLLKKKFILLKKNNFPEKINESKKNTFLFENRKLSEPINLYMSKNEIFS